LGIGTLYVALARGHADAGLARLAVARAASLVLLVVYALARRESLRPASGTLPTFLLAGALDMSANVLYILATGRGLLAIVAVLTSLYPASTVFLAWAFLKERLSPSQWAGVALAACGVALIAGA
jgi:drug/metabolite transporter (DMT)-like permease